MTFPMDTNHFAPITGGTPPDAVVINTPLAQLSGAISTLQQLVLTSIPVIYGTSLAARDAVYLNPDDGKVYKLDADDSTTASSIRGFVEEAGAASASGSMRISGLLSGFLGLTPFAHVYADSAIPGAITHTKPTATLDGSQVAVIDMGYAISATQIVVAPQPVKYHKRAALSDEETLTIQHFADALDYTRRLRAFATVPVAGTALYEYTSDNQDSDETLRQSAPATYTADQCTGGTVAFSSQHDGTTWAATNAFDDNTGTDWLSATAQAVPQWLEYNFGASKTIRRYTIRCRDEATTNAPTAFQIQYYDGSTWQTADSRSGQTWSTGETKTFDVSAPYTATRWRVYFTAAVSGDDISVSEIQMMEAATFAASNDQLAQIFQLAADEAVGSVDLYLKKTGSPDDTLTVRIETVDGSNDPTGTLVNANAEQTYSEASLDTSYGTINLVFPDSFTPGAGTYALVVSTGRTASETDSVHWGADASSPTFANGTLKKQVSGVWSDTGKDAIFAIKAPGSAIVTDLLIDEWASSSAKLVNRYGDADGNSLETETTFKCVDAGGIADVTVEVAL